ncbi:MAG: nuclear transport factor 2 family protein [Caulobacteraceae bacterium]|nr:nuclear transport factor 2 family protein [Caulobacteraceae bacterium]
MPNRYRIVQLAAAAASLSALASSALALPSDVAEIRSLEARFAAAVAARDVDGIMSAYAPGGDLVVFDVIPPRQYVGWPAYRKDWSDFLAGFKGPVHMDIDDLAVETSGDMGYSHSIQHVAATDLSGAPVVMNVRVTDVYRRTPAGWRIVHEHVSVPVAFPSLKVDMLSAP